MAAIDPREQGAFRGFPKEESPAGQLAYYPSTWVGVLAGGSHAPGRILALAATPPNSSQGSQFGFSSFHPSGIHFLLADGSARLLAETIQQSTFLALCTRASNDPVGTF